MTVLPGYRKKLENKQDVIVFIVIMNGYCITTVLPVQSLTESVMLVTCINSFQYLEIWKCIGLAVTLYFSYKHLLSWTVYLLPSCENYLKEVH